MLNKLIAALLVSCSLSAFAEVNFVKNEENYQVTAEQPVILDGTAVAHWKRTALDDDITYALQLYLIVETNPFATELNQLLDGENVQDAVVINLNYLDFSDGRLDAIREIFGEDEYEVISQKVGTYTKEGRFEIAKFMTVMECNHRDYYADFSSFKPTTLDVPSDLKLLEEGC
ncbi:MAG: hypothetical protein ACPHZ9_02325 [Neptunomonas phycophila]